MVSVAMTTCNGEKYIRKQMESVLVNLQQDDEVIVSDDGSTDKTLEIIDSFHDSRIRVISGPKAGINKNFENAIKNCSGDYIFLCDQDDWWKDDKIALVLKEFQDGNYILIEHDASVVDDDGRIIIPSFFEYRRVHHGVLRNTLRNTYHGCLMAFSKKLVDKVLPIPEKGCLHDQWIGLIAEMNGQTLFLNKNLMEYKRHLQNASSFKRLPLSREIKDRTILVINLTKYVLNRRKRK